MLRYAILLILLILPLSRSAEALAQEAGRGVAETLGLPEAIELALRQNRLVRVDKLEVEKASDRLAALTTRRLPAFDLSVLQLQWINPPEFRFPRGAFGVIPGLGAIPATPTNIGSSHGPSAFIVARATQPLTQLHRISLGMRLGEVNRELAESRVRSRQRDVAHDIRRSYYAILQTESGLRAAEETQKLYRELDRVVGVYVAQQTALASEILDVRAQLAKQDLEIIRLRNDNAAAREQLNQLLGRDIRTPFAVSEVSTATIYEADLAVAQSRATSERVELRELQQKLRLAEYDLRLKKAERIPEISLTAGYYSALGVAVLPRNATGVGFSLSWEPFDWGRSRHEESEKARTIEQAREGLREAESSILREVGDRFRRLEEARAALRLSNALQEAAREKLRIATDKYGLEAALYKDVLTAQVAVSEAQNQHQRALLAFWLARAEFEKAIGE